MLCRMAPFFALLPGLAELAWVKTTSQASEWPAEG
jgi:hypothetical protein